MDGYTELLEALNPSPMSPMRSIATLAIHLYVESGEYVPCWKAVGVPAGSRISYHLTPATLVPLARTVWLASSASWSPKLRYGTLYIRRSLRSSTRRLCQAAVCLTG